jgi:hypothetical protein
VSDPALGPSPDDNPIEEFPLFDHDESTCTTCTEEGPDRLLGDSRIFAVVIGSVLLVVLLLIVLAFALFDERWLH